MGYRSLMIPYLQQVHHLDCWAALPSAVVAKGILLLSVFQKRRFGARHPPLSKFNSSVTGYWILII